MTAIVGDLTERRPDAGEPSVIFCLLEQGECAVSKGLQPANVGILREVRAIEGGQHASECFAGLVASLLGLLRRSFRNRQRLLGRKNR